MTREEVLKIIIDENVSGKEPVHTWDLKLLVEVVNQHAKCIEKLMQKVEELENSIKSSKEIMSNESTDL